ncbi:unnamed protein product [Echinostoma caproni]|uniref:Uncharacterized protein n=1 Tax=Echinostoma caproni TaxID=27848 RepID=A0A183BCQ4_9TREM|nr:unnamed protein product [Echinostoma caproni]
MACLDNEGLLLTLQTHIKNKFDALNGTSLSGYWDAKGQSPKSGTTFPLKDIKMSDELVHKLGPNSTGATDEAPLGVVRFHPCPSRRKDHLVGSNSGHSS